MIRVGMVGLGKMGLSHVSIVRAHPEVEVVAACDTMTYLTDVLQKHTGLKCYADLDKMLAEEELDAVVISTPSRLHADMVQKALERDLDVFCEKPFVLELSHGERLVQLAETRGRVTQVGYYYRFIAAIQEAARVARSGALGTLHHVRVEAYGPVVLRPTGSTWRSSKSEGGGALHDYACHAIDVVNFVFGVPDAVSGVVLHGVFSREVEDEVYCSLHYANGASGQLCVNWSDESFRKMSTKVTVWGTNGRVTADRQECQVYLREPHTSLPDTPAGWTVRYTTELSKEVWFYLRGEEYSDQIDYFVQSVKQRRVDGENNFQTALQADRVASMILVSSAGGNSGPASGLTSRAPAAKSLWSKIFG
jgi:predicted dehydrogenase